MGTYDTRGGHPQHDPSFDQMPSDEECEYMTRQAILKEIDNEREYQVKKWGNGADDTKNQPNDWTAYIGHHSTRWFNGGFAPYDADTVAAFRKQMIKTAALAVAAVESIERQIAENGAPFYQKVNG